MIIVIPIKAIGNLEFLVVTSIGREHLLSKMKDFLKSRSFVLVLEIFEIYETPLREFKKQTPIRRYFLW